MSHVRASLQLRGCTPLLWPLGSILPFAFVLSPMALVRGGARCLIEATEDSMSPNSEAVWGLLINAPGLGLSGKDKQGAVESVRERARIGM